LKLLADWVSCGVPAFPLDLQDTAYSYLERPNTVLTGLVAKHVLRGTPEARVLDIGCGCGANAHELRGLAPRAHLVGIEPSAPAAELARTQGFDEVHEADVLSWLHASKAAAFQGVVLSDVLEHIADPVAMLKELAQAEALRDATWVVSVPNYAVWYNRIRTLLGRFSYQWSGLFDRTHLRFFTRDSIRELLGYCGFEVIEDRATPALAQSAAPLLRRMFEADLAEGNHLALESSGSYRFYNKAVAPIETAVCQLWPEMLGFQIVTVARVRSR
jgi:predicted TPR repeat methyltransferase